MEKHRTSPNLSRKVSFYVPPELLSLILARLPAKTLLRFRSVCKSWRSIIDHPDFVRMHSKLFNDNTRNKLLVTLERIGSHGLGGLILTVHESKRLNKTNHNRRCILGTYKILGYCKGLFLVRRSINHNGDSDIRVWNPSISKSLILPPCPLPCLHDDDILYVFGFARNIEDYKVIAISFEYRINILKPIRLTWAVYTLIDQQWTIRNNELNVSCLFVYRLRWKTGLFPSDRLYFEGATYWFGCDPSTVEDSYKSWEYDSDLEITDEVSDYLWEDLGREDNYEDTHLISLDIDTEKFTFWELPYGLDHKYGKKFLFVLKESLALFSISSRSSEIWVLNDDSQGRIWAHWFSGNSSSDGFELFDSRSCLSIFYLEKDGGCFICSNKSYNIVTCEVHTLNNSFSDFEQFETYTETLVLCNGYGAGAMTSIS